MDKEAVDYLISRGYTLLKDWCWLAPPWIKVGQALRGKEKDAVMYLIEEWDYGGVIV